MIRSDKISSEVKKLRVKNKMIRLHSRGTLGRGRYIPLTAPYFLVVYNTMHT